MKALKSQQNGDALKTQMGSIDASIAGSRGEELPQPYLWQTQ